MFFFDTEGTKIGNHFWPSLKYSYHYDIKLEEKSQPPGNVAKDELVLWYSVAWGLFQLKIKWHV